MGSTEYSIGLSEEKSSSRVLKPPGGGHSDIFGSPEVKANPPRPKYNQQNSSNMNCVMGTTDPNLKTQSESGQAAAPDGPKAAGQPSSVAASTPANQSDQPSGRSRVPPGGFSSGLW
uniref:Microtubule-associated protein Jupiter n=1 Tax=Culex tarsalis TaxID=7177 RepID=A0A1Q3F2J3_CULTA